MLLAWMDAARNPISVRLDHQTGSGSITGHRGAEIEEALAGGSS